MLNNGYRHGKPRVFNYVVDVDGAFRIAESGNFFTRDQASKHSILANLEEQGESIGNDLIQLNMRRYANYIKLYD